MLHFAITIRLSAPRLTMMTTEFSWIRDQRMGERADDNRSRAALLQPLVYRQAPVLPNLSTRETHGHPISPGGIAVANNEIVFRLAENLRTARVDYLRGEECFEILRGNEKDTEQIISVLRQHSQRSIHTGSEERIEYSDEMTSRMRRLGYLD